MFTCHSRREVTLKLKVFISYAREDRESALRYYDRLAAEGVTPWIDVKHLLPGQSWEAEIDRALSDAHVVMLLLSPRSVTKRGFVQREANDAIDRLRYKQPTDIYVIPLLLEPCEVPSFISGRLQYVDLSVDGSWDQVRAALRIASQQQSIHIEQGTEAGPFNVFTEKVSDLWEGLPGHEIDIDYPRFESRLKPTIAAELSALFKGRAYETLIAARQKPWDQSPDLFEGRHAGTMLNGRWDGYGLVHATDQLLSLTYEVGWYGAGAAHPNSHFETYNFAITDRLYRLELNEFFIDPAKAIEQISKVCIQELSKDYWLRTGEKPDERQIRWISDGAGNDSKNFSAFTVNEDHFTFLFAPYQVSGYAMGRWSADVSFYDLLDLLKLDGPHTFASTRRHAG